MSNNVAVIDYGMGNLHSVAKALEHVGALKVEVTSDPATILAADRVVLPGVRLRQRTAPSGAGPDRAQPGQ